VEFDLVFIDTGWEHPLTYEYVRGTLARALGPVVEIRGALSMEELVRRKGMFPSRFRRFCTDELKAAPMAAHLRRRIAAGERIVNAIGIRHEESAARAFALEWEFNGRFGCDVWAPIVRWTLDDVIAIHKRHGLAPNPLYLKRRIQGWVLAVHLRAEGRAPARRRDRSRPHRQAENAGGGRNHHAARSLRPRPRRMAGNARPRTGAGHAGAYKVDAEAGPVDKAVRRPVLLPGAPLRGRRSVPANRRSGRVGSHGQGRPASRALRTNERGHGLYAVGYVRGHHAARGRRRQMNGTRWQAPHTARPCASSTAPSSRRFRST
jgi:3'-phosphoadenosine 5'-phosphosulfate sulfotransferase (PAPS reductase)/FAD synthetase